jgi:hypothetical protein
MKTFGENKTKHVCQNHFFKTFEESLKTTFFETAKKFNQLCGFLVQKPDDFFQGFAKK